MKLLLVTHKIGMSVLIALVFGSFNACVGQTQRPNTPTVFKSEEHKVEMSYGDDWKKVEFEGEEILISLEYNTTPPTYARCNLSVFKNPTQHHDPVFWVEEFKKPGVAKYFGDNLPGGKSTFVKYRESKMGGVPAIETEFERPLPDALYAKLAKGLVLQTTRGKWVYMSICMASKEDFEIRRSDFLDFFSRINFVESDAK